MFSVIIVAAGSSRRMGFDKLMAPLAGVPVLSRSVLAFVNLPEVDEVILVTDAERYHQLGIKDAKLSSVDGGKDRHDSVANGLKAISKETNYIAVHDGARPLISSEQIASTLEAAKKHGAATSARKITETVKRSNSDNFITESVCRENLWLMETPQIFRTDLLQEAYSHIFANDALVTDEVSALEMIGYPTYLVENTSANPKITFPQDLPLAELLLKDRL